MSLNIGDACQFEAIPCVPKRLHSKHGKIVDTHANGFVFVEVDGEQHMTVPYALVARCPFCRAPRASYNATCTRSQCQEAAYYACLARSARGKRKEALTTKAVEAARVASHHPGWGFAS